MRIVRNLLILIVILGGLQACNTLYSYSLIDIEVVEPGKLLLPEKYSKAVIRYNNIAGSYKNENNWYFEDSQAYNDTTQLDSIAARLYFSSFLENLDKQVYFNSIKEIKPADYSNYFISDSLILSQHSDMTVINDSNVYPSISILKSN